jgi:L,D-transpeptidase YbiS
MAEPLNEPRATTAEATAPGATAAALVPATRWLGTLLVFLASAAATLFGVTWLLAARGGWYATWGLADVVVAAPPATIDEAAAAKLERRLASYAPRGIWVSIDSHLNRLRVYRGEELLRDAITSTGSGTVLKDPESGREWIFDTPQGERHVQRKVKDPIWNKPDWAFIEEGFQPPKNARDRVDDFSLGDYGLYLGDGYIIHGTLFQTLLGRRVTHGCIRLGDEDLEWVYWKVPIGARVYLY